MSFILDALKKSEMERQRQAIPGLVDAGIARPRMRLPVWAIALGILLAVNLLVLGFVLLHSWLAVPEPPHRAAATQAGTDERTSAGAAEHFSPLDTPTVYAPEIPVSTAAVSTAAPSMPGLPASKAATSSSALRAVHRRDPLLTAEDFKAGDDEVLPSINEINLTGAQALPELHLDVHVFATKPAERFVYVNMRKYHEGAVLEEGPTLERIRRDGVVLDYQGLRFLLPRQ